MRRIADRVVSHRGWIAALLATASILVLLLPWIRDAVDLPEWTESIGGYLLPLTAGLWLLAVLSIGLRRALLVEVSIVAYGLAFALPAADLSATRSAEETVAGYDAFGFGYVVEPLAWLANPGFLLALELHRSRGRRSSPSSRRFSRSPSSGRSCFLTKPHAAWRRYAMSACSSAARLPTRS